MVSVNAKGLTKQRSPLSPLGSTNGALPRNDGTAENSALHEMQKFLDTEELSNEGLQELDRHLADESRAEAKTRHVEEHALRFEVRLLLSAVRAL